MKKKIKMLMVVIGLVFMLPLIVKADTKTDALMKKLAPDLSNATFKMKKPTSMDEAWYGMAVYINNIINSTDYEIWADCVEPYNTCTIIFNDGENNVGEYEINITYDEPESNETVNGYITKMTEFDMDESNYYVVQDLSLINYYLTGNKSELWNPGAPSRAIKFSSMNKITEGANVSFYMVVGMGTENANLMYENAVGEVGLFYNGYMYVQKTEGVYLKRVIYIPSDTADSPEEYIKAAKKRISDYLGNDSVDILLGGALSDLNNEVKEHELEACLSNTDDPSECVLDDMPNAEDIDLPVVGHDGNYYLVSIGGREYKFYIVKGTEEDLKVPVYNGVNLSTNITVSSEDASVPLDASLTVNNVNDNTIKDKVGTEKYKAYDIKIHSDAKEADITSLSNGKFLVRIPIPEELKDLEELTVWYISSDGEKEEHVVTPKTINGKKYAEFETTHFSTYVLAESTVKETSRVQVVITDEGGKFTFKGGTLDGKTDYESSKSEFVEVGSSVTLKAKPNEGYGFAGWFKTSEVENKTTGKMEWTIGDVLSGMEEYTFTVTEPYYNIKPLFEKVAVCSGEKGHNNIWSTDGGKEAVLYVAGGKDGKTFESGTVVDYCVGDEITVKAKADEGYKFIGWYVSNVEKGPNYYDKNDLVSTSLEYTYKPGVTKVDGIDETINYLTAGFEKITEEENVPQTDDNIMIYFIFFIVSIITIVGTIMINKKEKYNN